MATVAGANPLELAVSNFGPIAQGRVELRPMSVFVGPSNTGKSYLAVLIYALHQFLGSFSGRSAYRSNFDRMFISGLPSIMPTQDIDLSADDIAVLNAWAQEGGPRPESILHPGSSVQASSCQRPVAALVRRVISGVEGVSEVLDDEIVRCFGIDKTEIWSVIRTTPKLGLPSGENPLRNQGIAVPSSTRLHSAGQGSNIGVSIPDTMPIRHRAEYTSPAGFSG